jgi:NADH:ubiquinone oxidoreductase subunit F (NADH-binding)
MTLTDRAAFESHAARARESYEKLHADDSWTIGVCVSEDSKAKGALDTFQHLRFRIESGDLDATLRLVGGGGWAWADPSVIVSGPGHPGVLYGNIGTDEVPELLESLGRHEALQTHVVGAFDDASDLPAISDHPFFAGQQRVLTRTWGRIDPYSIDEYIATGGYAAWVKALFDMTPQEVVDEVKASGIRGRGGAGFPAGIKWESGRRARAEPKFMACNSHEGEPNVYKDRRLIESDPHRVLEGIMLGCYGVGAERGYNYIGGEHLMALERFRHAVAEGYRLGLLGENILGTGVTCHVRVSAGGGAYICGEGSALMYSVMGERGQPRTKPPRSVEEGLWRRPTVLNNTETLAPVPDIITRGGAWYASLGTEGSTGTKLVTMQGPLARLGVVEVEMGASLRDVIFEMFGGMAEGKTLKGVQTGGVSAGPLLPEQLDVGLDFDSLTQLGGMLGSGGFIVFDESVDAVELGRYLMDFNRWESCSKCTPCRLGNKALVEIVDRILNGHGQPGDLGLIETAGKHVMELSLCGLGQVAPVPLLGMMHTYPEDFRAYLSEGRAIEAPTTIPLVAV